MDLSTTPTTHILSSDPEGKKEKCRGVLEVLEAGKVVQMLSPISTQVVSGLSSTRSPERPNVRSQSPQQRE